MILDHIPKEGRICPFVSTVIPVQAAPSIIQGEAPPIAPMPLLAGCAREKCEVWNKSKSGCALRVGFEKENVDA